MGWLNKMKKIFVASAIALVLAGCASSGNQQLSKESETSVQSKLQEGKTTKAEVKNTFGSPDNVSYTDGGNEIWKYSFAKVKVNGTSFIPFYGLFHNGTNGTKKELTILFKDDVVAKYTMAESAINTKTGWAD
jgi:outer membrane protein assembly factor BamE (lipoprotein component of BamABCDE complex)